VNEDLIPKFQDLDPGVYEYPPDSGQFYEWDGRQVREVNE
jgi:hypothetical protein